jgi:hypothetical protein
MSTIEISRPATRAATRSKPCVSEIRNANELDGLSREWGLVAADSSAIASNFEYQKAWAQGLNSRQQLRIFASAEAIAPLVKVRGFAQPLTLLAAEMFEPLDFPGRTTEAVEELVRAIRGTRLPLYLQRIPADSLVIPAVEKVFRGRAVIVRKPAASAPLIRLDETWCEPESHLNSGRRSDLRRARRAAEKLGAVETLILTPSQSETPDLLSEVLRVEAAGWKAAAGTALAADPVRRAFFARYCDAEARLGRLRICLLRIAGQNAAAQIAIQTSTRFSLLRAGYDETFARCSPGNLLTRESIRHAALAGTATYEFNGNVEPWTRLWTEDELACCSLRVFPFSATGITELCAQAAKTFLQGSKKHD